MSTQQLNEFNTFLTSNLNTSQYEAVTHKKGPLLIVAGAGSGKTRVITTRIAHLILNQNALPSTIIALTFTNKAAMEMKERIEHFMGGTHELPFVGTFHSFCLRLLKQNSELLDNPFFSILDEDDQHKILQTIIVKSGLHKKITAKQLAYQISHIKNQTINPDTHDLFSLNPLIREVYQAYEQEKKASKCLDFDDLLLEVVKLFKKNENFRKDFQQRVRHILVDEYQDTNIVQHELLKLMALENGNLSPAFAKASADRHSRGVRPELVEGRSIEANGNGKKTVRVDGGSKSRMETCLAIDSLCAVGDEDQSIYSWRGATVSNIMNFANDFRGTSIIKIEQNYRSVQPILDLANHVIAHNVNRNPKNLWSEKKGSDRIRTIAFLSEYQEAEAIAHYLKAAASKKQKLNKIAILYRTHFQSRALEEALLKHSIPYKIIGGIQFYERKEIKDILAYLKLVVNPFDRASFFRVINCPLRGLGNKFEEQFHEAWNANLFATFKDIAHQLIDQKEVTGIKKDALVDFIKIFESLSHIDKPSKAVEHFIVATNYFTYLKETYDQEEALAKIDNVKELIQAINHLESQKITTITDFLDEVALMQAQIQAESNEKDPVLLMTLHAAKGLEFDTVILTGLEEGLLPSSRSLTFEESVEEERRLFYVGITRAQERLLLTYSRYRYNFGTMTDQRPSRFVQEIPQSTVPIFDASYWQNVQMSQFFTQWINGTKSDKNSFYPEFAVQKKSDGDSKKSLLTKAATGLWKKNQPVKHDTFGLGIVQDIELRANGTFLQVKFKSGSKKIDATFVKAT
jgi:ATP-dependent DNA helicase UvrD/PcrA